jgi:hypothetical protein
LNEKTELFFGVAAELLLEGDGALGGNRGAFCLGFAFAGFKAGVLVVGVSAATAALESADLKFIFI